MNPNDSSNIIGVYQQDRYTFGGARGLAAAVSHDGGATWSSTYPHFSLCAGGTAANGGDYQRASDPWVAFAPNGDAYFISLSLSFMGDTSSTATAVLVSKSTNGLKRSASRSPGSIRRLPEVGWHPGCGSRLHGIHRGARDCGEKLRKLQGLRLRGALKRAQAGRKNGSE